MIKKFIVFFLSAFLAMSLFADSEEDEMAAMQR